MPILNAEADIYPDNLLTLVDDERRWQVLFTQPQREKELMRRLFSRQIPFYGVVAPSKKRAPNGRVRTSYLPLFSRYLFFYGNEDERVEALKTNFVSHIIPVTDPAQLRKDLLSVKSLIETGAPVTVENKLVVGQRVRIKTGNLMGHEGVIIRRRGVDHLVVAVNFLQQGASVLMGDFQVEPIV